jgi:hypothetical protein
LSGPDTTHKTISSDAITAVSIARVPPALQFQSSFISLRQFNFGIARSNETFGHCLSFTIGFHTRRPTKQVAPLDTIGVPLSPKHNLGVLTLVVVRFSLISRCTHRAYESRGAHAWRAFRGSRHHNVITVRGLSRLTFAKISARGGHSKLISLLISVGELATDLLLAKIN